MSLSLYSTARHCTNSCALLHHTFIHSRMHSLSLCCAMQRRELGRELRRGWECEQRGSGREPVLRLWCVREEGRGVFCSVLLCSMPLCCASWRGCSSYCCSVHEELLLYPVLPCYILHASNKRYATYRIYMLYVMLHILYLTTQCILVRACSVFRGGHHASRV